LRGIVVHGVYRSLLTGIVLIFIASLSACSFSNSSGSVSDSLGSVSGSSDSISGSSGSSSGTDDSVESSEESSRYQDEVADYTMAYIRSNISNMPQFKNSLSDIAEQEDVINWEQNPDTYIGFGRGLKRAGLSKTKYQTVKKNFAEGGYQKMKDIQKGFDVE